MADIRQRAVATAAEYDQGNIEPLPDAETRRLVASTVFSLGRSGDPEWVGKFGHVGRYEAGAGFLADAGYVDRERLAGAMAGYSTEWAWAKAGGMRTFLEDPANWKDGLTLESYRRSPELQDRAFKINAEQDYRRALHEGVIAPDEKSSRIAGFLKAAHIVGYHHAGEAMTGGRVYRSYDGTSNYDLIHDISRNKDGLDQRMNPVRDVADRVLPVTLASLEHPEHARHRDLVARLESVPGFGSDTERQNAAASIMVAAKAADLQRIDHLVPGPNGSLFAVQGDLRDPAHKMLALNIAELTAQPVERSTAQLTALGEPSSLSADGQRQERARGV